MALEERVRAASCTCALLMLLVSGCGTTPAATPQSERPLPQPATFQLSATLEVNLTPELSAQTGLPRSIEGTLRATARSEAISARPLRSRHKGQMSLVLNSGKEEQPLVNLNIDVNGEADGSPSQGLGDAMKRFLDAASLMTSALPRRAEEAAK